MLEQCYLFSARRYLLVALFIFSFASCLMFGSASIAKSKGNSLADQAVGTSICQVTSYVNLDEDLYQLVERGVDLYKKGCYQEAIDLWIRARSSYGEGDRIQEQAVIFENLARASQELGRITTRDVMMGEARTEKITGSIDYWNKALEAYRALRDRRQEGRILTERAQAHIQIGQYRRAIELLCNGLRDDLVEGQELPCADNSALRIAESEGDLLGKAAALGNLGEASRLLGIDLAEGYIKDSKEAAKQIWEDMSTSPGNRQYARSYYVAAVSSMGNYYVSQAIATYRRSDAAKEIGLNNKADELRDEGVQNDQKALGFFEESLGLARQQGDKAGQMRNLLASVAAHYRLIIAEELGKGTNAQVQRAEASKKTQEAIKILDQLPSSSSKVYAAINLSHLLALGSLQGESFSPLDVNEFLLPTQCLVSNFSDQAELLNKAKSIAERIGGIRIKSFAIGEIAHLYECNNQYSEALSLTSEARRLAENDLDSRYLWEWQSARLLTDQGQSPGEIIKSYEQAISTLNTNRSDILNSQRDIQFDFRDVVEPLYREFIEFRLSLSDKDENKFSSSQIDLALNTLDELRLAELQNYFGNDCLITLDNAEPITQAVSQGEKPTVISSIFFKNRAAILAQLPNGKVELRWIEQDRKTLTDSINEFRQNVSKYGNANIESFPGGSQEVYEAIIRPFEGVLPPANGKHTLIFVQDGIFRNIPMAALYDGKTNKFLIEQYAIATAPKLKLNVPRSTSRDVRVLALQLATEVSVDGKIFAKLDKESEVQNLEARFTTRTIENFTTEEFQRAIEQSPYSIIHFATHGKFDQGRQETYLVTGDSQESKRKLTIEKLDKILRRSFSRNPIELVSLAACETAVGDDRDVLGLAGVAADSARRVLASLWSINAQLTSEFMEKFYQNLSTHQELNVAQVLQITQVEFLNAKNGNATKHPAYWAPFILIGDWRGLYGS
jgi:CHAT domain-containing protein